MRTIKLKETLLVRHAIELISEQVSEGEKFLLKVKRGCRWKLRKARATWRYGHCECCGGYSSLQITMGSRCAYFDDHLGNPLLTPDSVLNPD